MTCRREIVFYIRNIPVKFIYLFRNQKKVPLSILIIPKSPKYLYQLFGDRRAVYYNLIFSKIKKKTMNCYTRAYIIASQAANRGLRTKGIPWLPPLDPLFLFLFPLSLPLSLLSLCGCGYSAPQMPRRQKRNRKARVRAGPYLRRVYPHLRVAPYRGNVHSTSTRVHAFARASTGMKTATPVSCSSAFGTMPAALCSIFNDDKLKCDLTLPSRFHPVNYLGTCAQNDRG